MRFVTSYVLGAAIGAVMACSAAAETLDCVVKPFDNKGWVQDRLLITLDAAGDRAFVRDALIVAIYGFQLKATLAEYSAARVKVTWLVKGVPTGNRSVPGAAERVSANYSAVYDPKTGKVFVTARVGNPQPSKGQGICKVVK